MGGMWSWWWWWTRSYMPAHTCTQRPDSTASGLPPGPEGRAAHWTAARGMVTFFQIVLLHTYWLFSQKHYDVLNYRLFVCFFSYTVYLKHFCGNIQDVFILCEAHNYFYCMDIPWVCLTNSQLMDIWDVSSISQAFHSISRHLYTSLTCLGISAAYSFRSEIDWLKAINTININKKCVLLSSKSPTYTVSNTILWVCVYTQP